MKVRASFMIPLYDNDGRQFSEEVMEHVRKTILGTFGGYTSDNVQGAWINEEGRIFYDESIRYTITMEKEKVAELKEILVYFKELLNQEAMYLEVQPVEVILV